MIAEAREKFRQAMDTAREKFRQHMPETRAALVALNRAVRDAVRELSK
ncbi:MAG: hypothetical protein JKY94_17655 [Rhodobacteraceae bacterium]|nr:hypothetical protein [Paracoccaceae bacterium]